MCNKAYLYKKAFQFFLVSPSCLSSSGTCKVHDIMSVSIEKSNVLTHAFIGPRSPALWSKTAGPVHCVYESWFSLYIKGFLRMLFVNLLTHFCRESLKGVHRQTVETQIMRHLIRVSTVCYQQFLSRAK